MKNVDFFLYSKAWMISAVALGIPVLVIAFVSTLLEGALSYNVKLAFFFGAGIFVYLVMLVWVWRIGGFLNRKLNFYRKQVILDIMFFSSFFSVLVFFFVYCTNILDENIQGHFDPYLLCFFIYGLLCGIGLHLYTAITLVNLENSVSIMERGYIYTCLLIWFSIFGLWIIQPRVHSFLDN